MLRLRHDQREECLAVLRLPAGCVIACWWLKSLKQKAPAPLTHFAGKKTLVVKNCATGSTWDPSTAAGNGKQLFAFQSDTAGQKLYNQVDGSCASACQACPVVVTGGIATVGDACTGTDSGRGLLVVNPSGEWIVQAADADTFCNPCHVLSLSVCWVGQLQMPICSSPSLEGPTR